MIQLLYLRLRLRQHWTTLVTETGTGEKTEMANYSHTPQKLIFLPKCPFLGFIASMSLLHTNNYCRTLFFNEISMTVTLYYVYDHNTHTHDISMLLKSIDNLIQ